MSRSVPGPLWTYERANRPLRTRRGRYGARTKRDNVTSHKDTDRNRNIPLETHDRRPVRQRHERRLRRRNPLLPIAPLGGEGGQGSGAKFIEAGDDKITQLINKWRKVRSPRRSRDGIREEKDEEQAWQGEE